MCFRNLIYKLVTLLPWFIFVFSFAVPLEAITLDRVIARINSDVITLGSLNDRMTVILNQMKAAGSNVDEMTEKDLMKEVLDSMIAEKLQVQEAKKLGMDVTEETIQNVLNDLYKDNNITEEQFQTVLSSEGNSMEAYKDSIRDQILASRISKMQIAGAGIVDEKVLRGYYRKNKKKYWVDKEVVVSHIMFLKDDGLSIKEKQFKKDKAQEVFQKIKAGEDFSVLAKQYSEDVSAHSGGKLGAIERGVMMPEFENVAFNLKVGEVSKVVETENGYHIIKCDNIVPGYVKGYKTVKPEIEKFLGSKKKEKKYKQWLKELKETSFVEILLFSDNAESTKNKVVRTRRTKTNNKDSESDRNNLESRSQKKISIKQNFSDRDFIEKKLKLYKKLYTSGKISKEKYLLKKKRLLEKL